MAITFGNSFKNEFEKFRLLKSTAEFQSSVVPFIQFMKQHLETPTHPYFSEIKNWRVELFNAERHFLYPHQVKALRGCFDGIILNDDKHTGYCFMPTSAGKGHILMTLAGLAVGDFQVQKIVSDTMPDIWAQFPDIFPILLSLGLEYSKIVKINDAPRTQILVHDTEILKQLNGDCEQMLGKELSSKIEFHSVQALRNETRRERLKYVIIDEAHWGNATEDETIQSSLIKVVTENGGKAFGFTASPYSAGKFQRTWSENKVNGDLNFNYYLDKQILYPVTLREVNLQNARVGFNEGEEEVDLTEKDQVINFMADFMKDQIGNPLDGPAICFFNATIIPDMVEALHNKRPDLKPFVKVLASDSAFFAEKCREMFGDQILATDEDIARMKKSEKLFLISRQKLLVGFNAPYLRYCFISPTNSKIIIMQGIGRLMRPVASESVPKKTAILFLTSLSGKKLDISGKGSDQTESEDQTDRDPSLPEDHDNPKTRYTTTSMTLSEAYDLPTPVFYKTEVGFRDFINQTRISDGNTVEVLKRKSIDAEELDKFDPIALREHVSRIRDMVRAQYKRAIIDRDSKTVGGKKVWYCHGKELLGSDGCERSMAEVNLEIHHKEPFTFAELYRTLGDQGVISWHSDAKNLKHLITLCDICHDKVHEKSDDGDEEVA